MKMNIKFSIPVSIFREGKYFVAYTPALDLSTSGKNFEEVKKRFEEIVLIFFEEIVSRGTLDEALGSLGWQKVKKQWLPPIPIVQKLEEFTIPLPV